MAVEIDKLYSKSWLSDGSKLIFLIMYAPLGLFLFSIRLCMTLQLIVASYILPEDTLLRKVALRIIFSVMGLIVREKGSSRKENHKKVFVSNHITPFDHLAVSLVEPCCGVSVYNLLPVISKVLRYREFGLSQGKETLKRNITRYINSEDSLPVLLHPEGATTNGQIALMKYNSWPFELEDVVYLIGLKVERCPILPLNVSALGNNWGSDLFFLLFSPYTVFTVMHIGSIRKGGEESQEDFAHRAQKKTAEILQLEASNFMLSDKLDYIKKVNREGVTSSPVRSQPDMNAMALRVKEVLPYLPLDLIKRDLARTRNVDNTISNFLEGNVPGPSQPPETTEEESDKLNGRAKSFGASANERTASLFERKQKLIERARLKYCEKNNIKLAGVNC